MTGGAPKPLNNWEAKEAGRETKMIKRIYEKKDLLSVNRGKEIREREKH